MLFFLSIISPLTSIIIGILILIYPHLLNYLVAAYLILTGIFALLVRNAVYW